MQQLWNWLMRADAKALFIACLLALVAMLGWRGYVEYDAYRDAAAAAEAVKVPPKLPDFPPYQGFGILEYVAEQSRDDNRALPVDLFRPSLDAMVSNLVTEILTNPEFVVEQPPAAPVPAERPTLRPGEENLFELVQRPDGQWVRRTRQQPAPELTYNGVFRRTDGRIAAWISERNSRTTKFYGEGDDVFGAKLKSVDTDAITVTMPDGREETMPRGGSVTLPAPPPVTEEVVVQAGTDDRSRRGERRGEGVFRRGGAQRMPTEAEIAAIERANPELAKRIREAIRSRQQRDQERGANR